MAEEQKGKLPALEAALVGTLAMASLICVRLWYIMADIRSALTDPMTMAVIITEDSIKADNKKAESMLDGARLAFADTERVVGLFSVALCLVAVALCFRIWRANRTGDQPVQQTKRKRPASR